MKKAVLTVEASYLVPLMLTFIALLLGFIYFTHQQNWCRAAAYESLYFGLQRNAEGSGPETEAADRLAERIEEAPLTLSEISSSVTAGVGELKAETKTQILPETFGDRFRSAQKVTVRKIEPALFKRTEWIIKYAWEQVNGK